MTLLYTGLVVATRHGGEHGSVETRRYDRKYLCQAPLRAVDLLVEGLVEPLDGELPFLLVDTAVGRVVGEETVDLTLDVRGLGVDTTVAVEKLGLLTGLLDYLRSST